MADNLKRTELYVDLPEQANKLGFLRKLGSNELYEWLNVPVIAHALW